MIRYLTKEDLVLIFKFLSLRYSRAEEIPQYLEEHIGCDKLWGILTQVQNDVYYPNVLDKATHTLTGINKGHFFSNGNKRLALVVATIFLAANNLQLKQHTKTEYRSVLAPLFPEYRQWSDYDDFTATDFAMYNLSIMVADSTVSHITYDELKMRVRTFFESSTEPSSTQ